jgi:hypothetical protein
MESRRHVAVVNEALVAQYFTDADPLGRTLRVPRLTQPPMNLEDDSFEIVGVVRDTVNREFSEPLRPELFVPYTLGGFAQRLVVRTEGSAESATALVRSAVAAIDRDSPARVSALRCLPCSRCWG